MTFIWNLLVQISLNFTCITIINCSIALAQPNYFMPDARALLQTLLMVTAVCVVHRLVGRLPINNWLARFALQLAAVIALVLGVGIGVLHWFGPNLLPILIVVASIVLTDVAVTLLYYLRGRRQDQQINASLRDKTD